MHHTSRYGRATAEASAQASLCKETLLQGVAPSFGADGTGDNGSSADCFITGLPGVHDDHDLARTAGEVNAFVFTLEKFVIHVYVLCSHGQMVPWKTFVLMCPATFKVCSRSVFHVLYLVVLPFASSHGAPILLYGRRSSLVKHPISI